MCFFKGYRERISPNQKKGCFWDYKKEDKDGKVKGKEESEFYWA